MGHARGTVVTLLLTVVLGSACDGSGDGDRPGPIGAEGAEDASPTSPAAAGVTADAFLLRGAPTFVLGTAGDAFADRAISIQVDLLRGFLTTPGLVVADTSFDPAAGAQAWPERPVLFGAPHQHAILRAIAPTLPFELGPDRLTLGREVFQGDGTAFVAVVPGRAPDEDGPGYPEFLLYAATGSPGIGEINARSRGTEAILVADSFGPLVTGGWTDDGTGRASAVLLPRAPRIEWRGMTAPLGAGAELTVQFPAQLPLPDDAAAVVDAVAAGTARVLERLSITDPEPLTVYVYPDRGSVQSLTGNAGDGHAVVGAATLHVVTADPAPGGALESLIAHEATHVLGYHAWGPQATPLLAEGLAVWVADSYAGMPLDRWAEQLGSAPPIAAILPGRAFRQVPEADSYPLAGLLVEIAVAEVGAGSVRDHLLGATAETWEEACMRAGTSAGALQEALAARLGSAGG